MDAAVRWTSNTATSFSVFPGRVERHPWSYRREDALSLPTLRITNLKDVIVTEEQWAQRDTVIGFGNDDGNVSLTDLLLKFGAPQNTETDEIELEGEGGFRGVGWHSAEASFYLPGSLAWPPDRWDNPPVDTGPPSGLRHGLLP
jgi:hypothetical protein